FVAALVVGLASNLFARVLRQPEAIPLIPGITILVPGVVGYRSVTALLERDTVSGIETAFAMTLTAVSLVAGLLFANVILAPRRVSPDDGSR
ncbi:MAG: threonine/serine exporter family protein, partial [Dehalococcoidia bacterium]|nr:threonine/serine exporter family protein [Dehalococcoidia bacterium]